jgi:hypothetical protein
MLVIRNEQMQTLNQKCGNAVQPCPWIEIELIDEDDQPVPGEKYKVEQSNGDVIYGILDKKGFVHLKVVSGNCKISFPDLDGEAWEKI